MALSTYSELQTSVTNFINRDDLTSLIPDFITLAEAHFNRSLRVPQMENSATSTLSGETLALPADFLAVRSMFLDRDPRVELDFVPYGTLRTQYASTATGMPVVYTIADGGFYFGPAPGDSYTLHMVYWQEIPALSVSNTSNWLLASHPDVYLYGSLVHAASYIRDDSALAQYVTITERLLDEINADGRKRQAGASPLVARDRRINWGPTSAKGVW